MFKFFSKQKLVNIQFSSPPLLIASHFHPWNLFIRNIFLECTLNVLKIFKLPFLWCYYSNIRFICLFFLWTSNSNGLPQKSLILSQMFIFRSSFHGCSEVKSLLPMQLPSLCIWFKIPFKPTFFPRFYSGNACLSQINMGIEFLISSSDP